VDPFGEMYKLQISPSWCRSVGKVATRMAGWPTACNSISRNCKKVYRPDVHIGSGTHQSSQVSWTSSGKV